MLEVEAMKEQLKLALGPKSVTIEIETDREARKKKLATFLIRASRAADIEMGHERNSSLQNDYIFSIYLFYFLFFIWLL